MCAGLEQGAPAAGEGLDDFTAQPSWGAQGSIVCIGPGGNTDGGGAVNDDIGRATGFNNACVVVAIALKPLSRGRVAFLQGADRSESGLLGRLRKENLLSQRLHLTRERYGEETEWNASIRIVPSDGGELESRL
jgi:hypothetical protein